MPGGRPRAFDADAVLDRALEVFWRQGYEGTALSDLTEAMGINKPSLYATFGNKEELFIRVLDRYAAGPSAYATQALEEPTARRVVKQLVYRAIELTTGRDTPHGCLMVLGVQGCGPDGEAARQQVIARRKAAHAALRKRLERAARAGDLPADVDPADLAGLVLAVTDGIAVQAAGGATRAQLRRVAEVALRSLPL